MNDLGFHFVRQGDQWVKHRDDGRRGPAVADEGVLWEALEAERERLRVLDAQLELLRNVSPEPKPARKR